MADRSTRGPAAPLQRPPAAPRTRSRLTAIVAVLASASVLVGAPATGTRRSQVGVGSPPVTGVDGGTVIQPTVLPTTTTTIAGPVSVIGATTTTVGVIAGSTSSTAAPITTSTIAAIVGSPDTTSTTALPTDSTTTSALSGVTTTVSGPTTTKAGPAKKPGAASLAELQARVAAALAPSTAGSVGALVVIDGGPTIFERNADAPLAPASTQKLYVAGASLATIGPDARYSTDAIAGGPIAAGVLSGDLFIRASGDPSFRSTNITGLAAAVKRAGITSVTGGLVLDDTRFDRVNRIPTWKALFTPGESGWLNAFSVDGNHRSDAASVADIGMANLARLQAALKSAGVTVTGSMRRGTAPLGVNPIAVQRSQLFADIVRYFMKKSDNTYAELVTKELGARAGAGTTAAGIQQIAAYMTKLDVSPPLLQEDGSGLSANNRSTARLQVRFLQRSLASSIGPVLRSALAVTCVDGTLKSRTCGTPASGKVFAKSGSIDNVVCLTGVTATASGKPVTFSILFNQVKSARLGRAAIDAALVEIASATI